MKNLRKFLSLVFGILFFISSQTAVLAAILPTSISYRNQVSKIVNEAGIDATVNILSESEAKTVKKSLRSKFDEIGLSKKLKDDSFKSVKESETTSTILEVKDNKSQTSVCIALFAYENKTGDVVLAQATYNPITGDLLMLDVRKADNVSNEAKPYFSYNEYTEKNESGIQTKGFTFNGKSFQCGVAGVVACIAYCLGWNIVGLIPGLVCDAACGLTMAAVCATAP